MDREDPKEIARRIVDQWWEEGGGCSTEYVSDSFDDLRERIAAAIEAERQA